MSDDRTARKLGLPAWILIGLISGAALGLFFGERVAFLGVVADGFIRLLQMAVLPYITISLVAGLGQLARGELRLIAGRVGVILLFLWAIGLVIIALVPLAFPPWHSASFFSTTLVETGKEIDLIGLYIPSNPFRSLSNDAVPAVVVFSIALGVALAGVRDRNVLIQSLEVLRKALTRVTSFVVSLTPIGVFAIAANALGTMSFQELARVQVYLFTYVAMALLLTFWVLPGLVAALTPIRHADVLKAAWESLITALATGSLLVVLPMLSERGKQLIRSSALDQEDSDSIVDVLVPVSYNFPSVGKLMTLSFVLFAAWFAGSAISLADYPTLAGSGLLTFFGSVNVALPFLLDLFQIPADLFQLFLAVGVVNFRFANMTGAMHTLVLAVLGTCAVGGKLRLRWGALLRYAVITVLATAAVLGGMRWILFNALDLTYRKDELVTEREALLEHGPATVHRSPPAVSMGRTPERSGIDRIRERGVLRVGYTPDRLPFTYFNKADRLVGFDVDMAHQLAADLGVGLEFVPLYREQIGEQLDAGLFDLMLTSLAVSTERSQQMTFTRPHLESTLAFIVRDDLRHDFANLERLSQAEEVVIAVPLVSDIQHRVRTRLPNAKVVSVTSPAEFFEEGRELVAMVYSAEAGAAWTLLYPRYTVVVPEDGGARVPLAYAVARGDQDLANFLTDWLELKKSDGTIDRLYQYWVLGRDEGRRQPRWSVIRDVLDWVD